MKNLLAASTLPLIALIATAATAQSIEDRLAKARTEVNATKNANSRALYAIERGDTAKARLEINNAENAAARALYAIDRAIEALADSTPPPPVVCPDGSTIPMGADCPAPPPTSVSWSVTALATADFARVTKACTTWPDEQPVAAGTFWRRLVPGPMAYPISHWAWGHSAWPNPGQGRYFYAVYPVDPATATVPPGAKPVDVYADCLEGMRPA